MNCELNVTAQEMMTLSTSQGMWVSGTRHIARKRLPHSSSHRSRSSPVRSELSCCENPVRRGRSPSVLRTEVPAPPHLLTSLISTDFTKTVPKTQPAVAYYSAQPPSTPLYLLPISASYTSHKSDKIQQLPNPQVKNNDGNKIVKKILRLIIKNAMKSVGNQAKSHLSHHMQQVSDIVKNCDVAIQTTSSAADRHFLIEDEDICSFSSESGEGHEGWQWDVRALRDSHVRLVLRQLRQLSDIERLARALRRNPHPHRRATSHQNPADI